jgi:hypothetical protein
MVSAAVVTPVRTVFLAVLASEHINIILVEFATKIGLPVAPSLFTVLFHFVLLSLPKGANIALDRNK